MSLPIPKKRIQTISLSPPSLQDNTADAQRLQTELKACFGIQVVHMDLDLLKVLPARLRKWNYKLRCVVLDDGRCGYVTGIGDPEADTVFSGVAVDIGTTRVVTRLVDLEKEIVLAEDAFDNPQIAVGPDILARIHHADMEGGLEKLNKLIVEGINRSIGRLCRQAAGKSSNVALIALAGNTAMTHLFLGLSPRWMIREPYIPAVNVPGIFKAAELGLAAGAFACAYVFPNIGSYFGGDVIAGILTTGIHRREENAILVDVGTNAEVVLGNQNWLIACAGAAGPALEGGVTRMGMMAAPGVIDRIKIDGSSGRWQINTIQDEKPVGICGSGLIDLTAQLFLNGMLDIRGKLQPEACGARFAEKEGLAHLTVVFGAEAENGLDLTISQADLDSLIRSKAAMFTILETITQSVGITFDDLTRFYVAGTFGAFIDPKAAITIGMLPDLDLDRFEAVGNSSLNGASAFLTDRSLAAEIEAIRQQITYMELNVNQDFMNRFSAAKFLPHTDTTRFPSVPIRR